MSVFLGPYCSLACRREAKLVGCKDEHGGSGLGNRLDKVEMLGNKFLKHNGAVSHYFLLLICLICFSFMFSASYFLTS